MKKKRNFAIGVLICVLLFASLSYAATHTQRVEAFLAHDMTFRVDGETWQPRDLDGRPLTPIIYNGRSYLPARALLEDRGVAVGFDANTRTIILDYPQSFSPLIEGVEIVKYPDGSTIAAKTISTKSLDKSTPKLAEIIVQETSISLLANAEIYVDGKKLEGSLQEIARSGQVFDIAGAKLYLNENEQVFRAELSGYNPDVVHFAGRTSVEVEVSCCPLKIKITIKF